MNSFKRFFLNDYCILMLIVANALIIFIQEFDVHEILLNYVEPFFTLLFMIEMVVKINHWGFRKYFSDGWNRFDFFLIIISIPSLGILFFGADSLHLNILLTLRAFRVFKFFRLIRFFPNVSALIKSVKNAMKASYVVIAGFFLLLFIFSVVTCSLFKNTVPEYFNNPLNSFYSIFRLFSVEGWYEIPDLIATRTSPTVEIFSKLYFAILLLGGGILGLSIVNSIFVDAMMKDDSDNIRDEIVRLGDKIDALTTKIEEMQKM